MKKYAIKISYDGKNYSGWQEQPGKVTVQGVMQDALAQIFHEKVKLYASGRTDAGVSALGQVAHFRVEELPRGFVGYINTLLPEDIRVLNVAEVSEDFHVRFSSKKKTYIYKMYMSKVEVPVYERGAWRIPTNIDIEKMKKEMRALKGKHDFSAFCASNTAVEDKVRQIYSISIKKVGSEVVFSITGNGFLYNMVRIIVGTLVEIGLGKKDDIQSILESCDRAKSGKTAPAKGLVLKEVVYKDLKWA